MTASDEKAEAEADADATPSRDGSSRGVAASPAAAPLPLDWTRLGRQQEERQRVQRDDDEEIGPYSAVRYPWDVASIEPHAVAMAGSAVQADGESYDGTDVRADADADIDADIDDELVIVGTAGQKITRMGTGRDLVTRCGRPNLRKLVLRSHLIRTIEGLDGFRRLELLELYDNQIDSLEGLSSGDDDNDDNDGTRGKTPAATLKTLDMSYNVVRDMGPVSACTNLVELYLAQNKLKEICGLRNLSNLRKIDLGANRIRVMPEEELDGLVSLEELWLGKNKIERIDGLSKLTKLRRLDVQANRLTSIDNLTSQIDTLEELYLSHNGIDDDGASTPTGLALSFSKLSTLDLSRNRLESTKPFGHLHALEDLWLSGNRISTFEDVEFLCQLSTSDSLSVSQEGGGNEDGDENGSGRGLKVLYLEMNPIANEFEYRKKLALMIPTLVQIDADAIRRETTMSADLEGGGGNRIAELTVARMRRLQEMALARAREQTEREEMERQGQGQGLKQEEEKEQR